METLRKFFPYSFQYKKDIGALIVNVLLHIVAGIVIGFVLAICLFIPVINIIAALASKLVELYLAIGVILSVLDYCNVLK